MTRILTNCRNFRHEDARPFGVMETEEFAFDCWVDFSDWCGSGLLLDAAQPSRRMRDACGLKKERATLGA